MAIKSLQDRKYPNRIEIDLSGPDGNAYALMSIARTLGNQLSMNVDEIIANMMSSDYENLVQVMDDNFGDFITMWR